MSIRSYQITPAQKPLTAISKRAPSSPSLVLALVPGCISLVSGWRLKFDSYILADFGQQVSDDISDLIMVGKLPLGHESKC